MGVTHCVPKCCCVMHPSVIVLVTPIKEVEGNRGFRFTMSTTLVTLIKEVKGG